MKPIRTVFDTNVYLAAVKKHSYASTHLKRSQPNGPYALFISPEIIIEIRRKLEEKFNYSTEDSALFIDMIMLYANLVQPKQKVHGVLEDLDDHIILECALEAKAEMIVSSDRGLLRLKEFQGIKIIHPSILKYLS
ncbi:MAG TPA: putative toxin-antitoxin system toxin component, PIN family [Candidatus Saccharimonadales bacterium]|nr:putative toxin-antitoxin system toxin component, PIN family [Candidatus Saccharimonadales bacterium]